MHLISCCFSDSIYFLDCLMSLSSLISLIFLMYLIFIVFLISLIFMFFFVSDFSEFTDFSDVSDFCVSDVPIFLSSSISPFFLMYLILVFHFWWHPRWKPTIFFCCLTIYILFFVVVRSSICLCIFLIMVWHVSYDSLT